MGVSIKFDRVKFAKNLAEKENLVCNKVYFYNAPPFQSKLPTKEEKLRKEGYYRFKLSILKNKEVIIREGRCQRIINENRKIEYKQKGVDILLAMDLMTVPLKNPEIKKVILVSSDTDFCPVIEELKTKGIEVILYSYHEKIRESKFSISNHLIRCCSKYIQLSREDFENAPLTNSDKIKNG